jgi:hypothetical protein
MKGLLRSLIVCLVTIGAVYVYTAYDEHAKEVGRLQWPSVEGRFVTEADRLPAKLDGRIQTLPIDSPSTGILSSIFTFPYERFIYSVNGKPIIGERTGLPCLNFVRDYCTAKEIQQQNRTTIYDAEVLNSIYSQVDPTTGKAGSPSGDELLADFGPSAKIYYDPSKPTIGMVDPNTTSFVSSILYSGLAMCLAGAVIFLLISWHDWMLRDTDFEERVPDYFYDVTGRYTGVHRIRPVEAVEEAPAVLPAAGKPIPTGAAPIETKSAAE